MAEIEPDRLRAAHQHLRQKVEQSDLRAQGKSRFTSETQQRKEVGKGDSKLTEPTFLRPQDIQKGVTYDVEKVFYTTLGNEIRRVNRDDLVAFQKNIELLQDQYKRGITAKQVINLSLPFDIKKSNEQIFMAVPLSIKNGVVHFMTNASKESNVTEHHVNVEFLNYQSLILQPTAITADAVKKKLMYGKLKFECDCGRHTYWFRYIASIGGYGFGRIEEGYPKLTNPHLAGVACKHVLRVMHYILSPAFTQYITKQLQKERSKQAGQRRKQTDRQLIKELDRQFEIIESKTNKVIARNDKAAQREMMRRANNYNKAKQREAEKRQKQELEKVAKEQGKDAADKIIQKQKQDALRTLDSLLASKLITPEQYAFYKRGTK
ncbi:hypothetical protein GCM10023206_06990 [Acinetobacter puyangensis]|uniref:SWIM-type domain-containing protein n=1 Tax=Acinetobacter puyangensis TaxID=1096779 RepID=A0A240E6T8_9GAMM|nr:hypothetical protein [Acinetobacter puyangensis]SNX44221.1 hypothetical protein SAMN05421731_102382 [Acinetobacter puyangensis]